MIKLRDFYIELFDIDPTAMELNEPILSHSCNDTWK